MVFREQMIFTTEARRTQRKISFLTDRETTIGQKTSTLRVCCLVLPRCFSFADISRQMKNMPVSVASVSLW